MTYKFKSGEAYLDMQALGDKVFRMDTFGSEDIKESLAALSGLRGVDVPSAKSFMDWARKERLVEGVTGVRGRYRWVEGAEPGEAVPDEKVVVTDMDPENPMVLPEEGGHIPSADEFYRFMMDTADHLTEEQEKDEMAQDIRDAADMRPENLYIIMDDVKRLPRKEKKRMKRELLRNTSAQKVTFSYLNWAS